MAIVRAPRPQRNYTELRNDVLRDKRLSYRARGILGRLLSNEDGYSMTANDLANESTEGRGAVLTALKELRNSGYIVTARHQNELGHWKTLTYVFDSPQNTEVQKPDFGLSDTEVQKPDSGLPDAGFLDANRTNKRINKRKESSSQPAGREKNDPVSAAAAFVIIDNLEDELLYNTLIELYGSAEIIDAAKTIRKASKRPYLSNIQKFLNEKAAAAHQQAAEARLAELRAIKPEQAAANRGGVQKETPAEKEARLAKAKRNMEEVRAVLNRASV